jgi:hypothetical protein
MSTQPSAALPFVKATRGPRGVSRTNHWAVKPSGDYEKDFRLGREHALQFMAYENERQRTDPEAAPIIGSIVKDVIASGDRGGIAKGFFTTLVECSRFNWQPGEIDRFRHHYEQIDREFDEAMAAVRRKKRPPVPAGAASVAV